MWLDYFVLHFSLCLDKNSSVNTKRQKLAQVIIPSSLRDPLIYSVPSSLDELLKIGMRVVVPLGARKVAGVVVDFQ